MIFIARAFCPLVLEIECIEQVCVQNVLFHHHKEETHNIGKAFTSL